VVEAFPFDDELEPAPWGRGYVTEDLSKKREDLVGIRNDEAEAWLRESDGSRREVRRGAPSRTLKDVKGMFRVAEALRQRSTASPHEPARALARHIESPEFWLGVAVLDPGLAGIDARAASAVLGRGFSKSRVYEYRKRQRELAKTMRLLGELVSAGSRGQNSP
jgi:hypothetical protein